MRASQTPRPSVLDRLTAAEQQRLIDVLTDLLLSAAENIAREKDQAHAARDCEAS